MKTTLPIQSQTDHSGEKARLVVEKANQPPEALLKAQM